MNSLEHFLVAAVLFVLIDAVWLKAASSFYKGQLSGLLASKPDFIAAAIFYILYIIGMVVFVINPALGHMSYSYAVTHGALLGLLMYGTYDLTNRSTLKLWPWKLVLVDMTWGTLVTAAVTVLTYLIFS